jgi:hypothetical protein
MPPHRLGRTRVLSSVERYSVKARFGADPPQLEATRRGAAQVPGRPRVQHGQSVEGCRARPALGAVHRPEAQRGDHSPANSPRASSQPGRSCHFESGTRVGQTGRRRSALVHRARAAAGIATSVGVAADLFSSWPQPTHASMASTRPAVPAAIRRLPASRRLRVRPLARRGSQRGRINVRQAWVTTTSQTACWISSSRVQMTLG